MSIGQVVEHVGHDIRAEFPRLTAYQPVAHTDQVVAHVDRGGNAVPPMERVVTVTEGVIILDVVVHQRGLVKDLHGQGHPLHRVRKPRRLCGPVSPAGVPSSQRVVGGQGDKGAEVFASLEQEIPGDRFGDTERL